jgi:hypothetical protein
MRFKSDKQRRFLMSMFSNSSAGVGRLCSHFSESAFPKIIHGSKSKLHGKLGKHENMWRAETDAPSIDRTLEDPTLEHRDYDVALTEMTPDEFLDMQYKQATFKGSDLSKEDWMRPSSFKLQRALDIMHGVYEDPNPKYRYEKGTRLPMPYIEYDRSGNLTGYQEGRHRGLAAKLEGLETIPVLIAVRRFGGEQ